MILQAFNNGYCESNQYFISKKRKKKQIRFPATFFYFESPEAKILIDAGYSPRMKTPNNTFRMKAYAKLMHLHCQQTTSEVLKNNGIDPKQIDHIILSHFHPDHFGGLNEFPQAKIICTQDAFSEIKHKKWWNLKNLADKNYIPADIHQRIHFLENYPTTKVKKLDFEFYDILSTGQLLGFHLPGHNQGQMGLLIPDKNALYISDAAWCTENFEAMILPRTIAQWIVMDNPAEYKKSLEKIRQIRKKFEKLDILYTHDERFLEKKYDF